MNDAVKLKRMTRAAGELVDAIMRDEGGFSVETLHAMLKLANLAGLPDDKPVTAVTGWRMRSESAEPRMWGELPPVAADRN
jgi:hypothetical protein